MTQQTPDFVGVESTLLALIAEIDAILVLPPEAEFSVDGLDHRVEALCNAALRLGPDRTALQPAMDALNERLEVLAQKVTQRRDAISQEMNKQTVRTTALRAYNRPMR